MEKVEKSGVTEYRHYIRGVKGIVAVQTTPSVGAATTHYVYRDHLGSTTLILNESAVLAERLSYDAQGKRRHPNGTDDATNSIYGNFTDRGYTSHEHLDGLDFVHMNGRIYDAKLGRFASADPIVVSAEEPQRLNRFTYVLNQPLGRTDPTGFVDESDQPQPVAFEDGSYTGTDTSGLDIRVEDPYGETGPMIVWGTRLPPEDDSGENSPVGNGFRMDTAGGSSGGSNDRDGSRNRPGRNRPPPRSTPRGNPEGTAQQKKECYNTCLSISRDVFMTTHVTVCAVGTFFGAMSGAAIGRGNPIAIIAGAGAGFAAGSIISTAHFYSNQVQSCRYQCGI